MNYFKEYTDKLLSLQRGEKTKIDVHFIVSEPLRSFCYEVNQNIGKHNIGFVNMSVKSIILPHISLFMGFVDNYKMLENLFDKINEYAKTLSPFTLNPTNMYFKGMSLSKPQYLFIDSLETDFLMEQKRVLNDYLEDIVYPNDWDMLNEKAHITVACYKHLTPSIRESIDEYMSIPPCRISQIGISITGKYGVCFGLLKVFDL